MASLLFPDAGSRHAVDPLGRPALVKPVVVYADSAGATLAEIYVDQDGDYRVVTAEALGAINKLIKADSARTRCERKVAEKFKNAGR